MKSDSYHDSVPVCNTEYDTEVFYEDGEWHWAVNATDFDYDGEEISTGGVADGVAADEGEARKLADMYSIRAVTEAK